MAIIDEVSERGLGIPLGIGLLVAAVSVGPKLIKSGRPLMKRAIKGYLVVQEKTREMLAETSERMQDLYAEAKHEFDEEAQMVKAGEVSTQEQHEEPSATEGAKPSRTRKKKETEEGQQ